MAKRRKDLPNPIQGSVRWPRQFDNPAAVERSQSLVDSPAWAEMEAEWADQEADLLSRLRHDRSHEHDDFYRGQLATLEMMLGFRKDLADWKADHR